MTERRKMRTRASPTRRAGNGNEGFLINVLNERMCKMTKMKEMLVVAVMVVFLTVGSASAASIFIDILGGSYEPPSPDTQGRYWNSTGSHEGDGNPKTIGYKLTNAIDEDGVATTVDLKLLDAFDAYNKGGLTASSITDWAGNVTRDSWCLTSSTAIAEIRFEGLTGGASYDLTFYGSRNTTGTRAMDVAIDGTTQSFNCVTEGMTTFTGVTADADGYITVGFGVASGSSYAYLSGVEIDLIPEPATLCLLGIGGIGMLIRKKRS